MSSTTSAPARTKALIAGGVGIALVIALITWFLGRDTPDAVSLDGALDQPGTEQSEAAADDDAPAAGSTDVDPQGAWAVSTDVREFSFAESTGTFVGFRIAEELSSVGATEAVGRIPVVSGQLTVDGSQITAASFEADATTLTTDDTRRDNRARGALGTDTNPTLSFVLTSPIDLGSEPEVDQAYSAVATGDLTVNGVTNSVEVLLEAQVDGSGVLVVTGSFDVLLSDYDVQAPSAPIVLSVSDTATVELQLLLVKP